MKVKFKNNPLMQYDLISSSQTHYNLSIIGMVPKEEIVPCEDSDDLVDIVDVAVYLTNNQ